MDKQLKVNIMRVKSELLVQIDEVTKSSNANANTPSTDDNEKKKREILKKR